MALTGLLRSWPLGGTVHESGRQVRPYRLRAFQPIETGGQFGGEVTGGRGPGCVHSPRRVLPARRRGARYRRLRPDGGTRTRGGPAPPALTSARQGDGGGRPRERQVPARYPSRTPRPTGLRCGRPLRQHLSRRRSAPARPPTGGPRRAPCRWSVGAGLRRRRAPRYGQRGGTGCRRGPGRNA